MEKQIITAVRYQIENGYFVEGCEEVASTGTRDYWLCKKGTNHKKFLFSCRYMGVLQEEKMLKDELKMYFRERKPALA